jgi:hypothetical protein
MGAPPIKTVSPSSLVAIKTKAAVAPGILPPLAQKHDGIHGSLIKSTSRIQRPPSGSLFVWLFGLSAIVKMDH